jgi:hypothetical protein
MGLLSMCSLLYKLRCLYCADIVLLCNRLWDLEKAGGEGKEGKELKATINAGPTEAWYAPHCVLAVL